MLGEWPIQGLDDTILIVEAKYPIDFTKPNKIFVLNLPYNGSNIFLFFNATKIYPFKAKNSEVKDSFCVGNISKDFTIVNRKKNRIKRKCIFFCSF